MASKQKIYAVKKGNKEGLFYTWEECQAAIEGFSSPVPVLILTYSPFSNTTTLSPSSVAIVSTSSSPVPLYNLP